jgi:hypothetical protein
MTDIKKLIQQFSSDIVTAVRREAVAEFVAKFNGPLPAVRMAPKKPRRKGPIQLCPVPGCKGRAAPVFGMVCINHKDVSKAKIKAYREARRAKKAKRG